MSHSPDELATSGQLLQYDRGWAALNKLLRAGRSFSGRERNCCFLNIGDHHRFANISSASGLDLIHDGRAVALSDWDQDGDLDLWLASRTGPRIRFLRNDMANDVNFVAFQLEGVTSNRDAIGARVRLYRTAEDELPLMRTLSAGHGYLAQSSKWVHFGLGQDARIDRIEIQWPGGNEPQVIRELSAQTRYFVRQGQAATIVPAESPTQPSEPSNPQENPGSDQARVVLLEPALLPQTEYIDSHGDVQQIDSGAGNARLINLWATWCQPCLVELHEWSTYAKQFADAGLDVLAICVDEGTEDAAADRRRVLAMSQQLKLPFAVGFPAAETVSTLDVVQRTFIGKQRPLPVPASFLIDRKGQVVAIYRGPVSPTQVIKDVTLLDATADERLKAAIPFAGRWLETPDPTAASALANAMIDTGKFVSARDYLLRLIDVYLAEYEQATENRKPAIASSLALAYETVGRLWLDARETNRALEAFQQSLDVIPNRRSVLLEMVHAYTAKQDSENAAKTLEQILALRPDDPENLVQLARIRASQGRISDAVRLTRQAAHVKPTSSHFALLGRMLLAAGKIAEAMDELSRAVQLQPDWAPPANDLAWLLATNPNASLRDGERAVALATKAVELTGGEHAGYLDTLAASYAEAGRYEAAIATIDRALQLVASAENVETQNKLRRRRDLYQQGRPYRDGV